jgi:hypothetical protein
VVCSLGSVLKTRCWAKVVFCFWSVLGLLLRNDNKQVVFFLVRSGAVEKVCMYVSVLNMVTGPDGALHLE